MEAGERIVYGGRFVTTVSPELADAFEPGDRLVVVQADGALLHIPEREAGVVSEALTRTSAAFHALASVDDASITEFFDRFAALLEDDEVFAPVAIANAADVGAAAAKGRSTTRLELTAKMRADMAAGLRVWRDTTGSRDVAVDRIDHDGWSVEARRAPLGVVGFVFEGRPNVFADACGVIRSGNTAVFRIGSDALGTATAIMEHALRPAVVAAGLPDGVVELIPSAARSAGHALFSDDRLALAVARGSGAAVAQLGAVASQAGVPVSLHGTGGAWIVAGAAADSTELHDAVEHSLDRKVCNTLNCAVVLRTRAAELVPVVVDALRAAASTRGTEPRLHVVEGSEQFVPSELFDTTVLVNRAGGDVEEPMATSITPDGLATEWEWEGSPEITLVVVDTVAEATRAFNTHSPRFVASLLSDDAIEQEHFWSTIDAPFVGNGFTRWVDGQYALDQPELGLSNWQGGRMLGRGGILSGDSVHTVRYRATVTDTSTHR
ncbi:MAG: aldehyde dehydrogenase family protein [Ilumatobacter sp.]